jgi:carbon monoxide dehydrogenase subunit G
LIIDQTVTIAAPVERVWDFMMDVPQVSTCVPGVESVEMISPDVYKGILGVKIGPIGVRLEGQVTLVEQNRDDWQARMDIEATDRKIRGAVNAKAFMKLTPREDGQTDLAIHTDASIFGKLGQFGQAVMKKKADQVVGEFARNMAAKLAEPEADALAPDPEATVTDPAVAEGGRTSRAEIEVPEKVS